MSERTPEPQSPDVTPQPPAPHPPDEEKEAPGENGKRESEK
jgi:hypothetical protein